MEERIFDLQEQKRKLAEAAVEGKAIAKLSMKDILNLFKHDAEQTWNDKAHEGIGARSRVLEPAKVGGGGGGSQGGSQQGGRAGFGSGPGLSVMGDVRAVSGGDGASSSKGRVVSGKGAEHAVYGRRW